MRGVTEHLTTGERVAWYRRAPNPGEGDKVLYLFDGGCLGEDERQRIALPTNELRSCDFHDAQQLPELTIPRLVRRITASIEARANGATAYLEHGTAPGAAS
ncbi:hypothetical protein [Streptomyces sp. Inha503]|uniref:hypothetical protein n=1 Tax=Streptomyces sp. Inha503 TaxID=3383314 RepID=UPI0039A3027E